MNYLYYEMRERVNPLIGQTPKLGVCPIKVELFHKK